MAYRQCYFQLLLANFLKHHITSNPYRIEKHGPKSNFFYVKISCLYSSYSYNYFILRLLKQFKNDQGALVLKPFFYIKALEYQVLNSDWEYINMFSYARKNIQMWKVFLSFSLKKPSTDCSIISVTIVTERLMKSEISSRILQKYYYFQLL